MQGTLAGLPAMEPRVFDGNLHPRLATVSANADTKSEDGHTPPRPSLHQQEEAAEPEESWEEPDYRVNAYFLAIPRKPEGSNISTPEDRSPRVPVLRVNGYHVNKRIPQTDPLDFPK